MIRASYWIGMVLIFTTTACSERNTMKELYELELKRIDGSVLSMHEFKGKTLLIVNTASRCGFTGQYDELQRLYERYKDRDFLVLAFPSNNFMGQEPGSDAQIATFCKTRFHITFPLFAKIEVKGKQQHPLYRWLTSKELHPIHGGKITWNFNKFLLSPEGELLARFGSRQSPTDPLLIKAIEAALPDVIYH